MAFVYRNQKEVKSRAETPGPGQYIQKNQNGDVRLASAPFNQASKRKLWANNVNPGPGSYDIKQSFAEQNKIMENLSENIIIYHAPKQSCAFKSNTKRFIISQQQNPGPGEYKFESVEPTDKNIYEKTHGNPSKLKKYLKELNKLTGDLLFDKEIGLGCEEQVNRQNQIQYVQTKKIKRSNPVFCSKVQRNQKIRPQTSAGPGSYNIQSCFTTSNSIKQSEFVKQNVTKSILKVKNEPTFKHSEEEIGPGYYINQDTQSFFNKKHSNSQNKIEFFGSKSRRFQKLKRQWTPGPASYDVAAFDQSLRNSTKVRSKASFGIKTKTTIITPQPRYISPFGDQKSTTSIKQSRVNHSKRKITKKVDAFGSKQQRFKAIKNVEPFDEQPVIFCGVSNQVIDNSSFKKKYTRIDLKKCKISKQNHVPLKIEKNLVDNRPLCYDVDGKTLGKKFKEATQINAPFNSYSIRFSEKKICQQIQKSIISQMNQKKPKQSEVPPDQKAIGTSSMISKEPRFKCTHTEDHLGPQTYNASKPQKKQFNKLFI